MTEIVHEVAPGLPLGWRHDLPAAGILQELLTLLRQNENHRLLLEKTQILKWRINELLH